MKMFQFRLCIVLTTAMASFGCSDRSQRKQVATASIRNQKLAALANEAMSVTCSGALREKSAVPPVPELCTAFLRQVHEYQKFCRNGDTAPDRFKSNNINYHKRRVIMADGSTEDIFSTGSCDDSHPEWPEVIVRLIMKDGVVVEAFTDGNEKKADVEYARLLMRGMAAGIESHVAFGESTRRYQQSVQDERTAKQRELTDPNRAKKIEQSWE